jgi:hypothetical protein
MMYAPKIGQKVQLDASRSINHGRTFVVHAIYDGCIVEMHKPGTSGTFMEHIYNLIDLKCDLSFSKAELDQLAAARRAKRHRATVA